MAALAEALSLAALTAGTLEYAILIRHREERRQATRDDDWLQASARRALYRNGLIEQHPRRTWSAFGTRFR